MSQEIFIFETRNDTQPAVGTPYRDGNIVVPPANWASQDPAIADSTLADLRRWVAIWEWWEGRFTLSRLFEWPEKPEVDALESTQAQAEAGTDDAAANSTRMTPRRVLQAILALSPFTSTLATKLAGIETGAQVNPQHFIRFAAEDADTLPASDLQDGEIGLYGSDGTTQHQSGDIADIGTIYLPKSAADFGQDAANPGTDLDAYDTTRMFRWIVDNPGASVIVSLTERGSTNTVFFQVDQIAPYGTTGYRLSSLTHLRGGHTPESSGVSWNVTATLTFAVGTKDILDLVDTLAKYVLRTDLEGHDSDEFASYSNGLFGSNYFPGNFCLFTGTTQPTDDTRAIRGPDIATGSGVLVWGDLRADSNPDTAWTPEALVAADWPSGRIIHVSPWHPFNNDGHIRITLTSAASLVGTGNAAHLWAQASWTVVGSLTPTLQSDYYRWSENVPSDLDAEFPPSVIPNAPWVAPTGTSKTDATLSVEDKLLLDTGDDVPIGELYEHHDLFHTGLAELAGYNYVTNSSPPNAGDVYVAGPVGVNTGNYSIKPASDDDKALLKAVIRAGKRVRYAVSATRYVEFKPGGLPAELFGRISGTIPPGSGNYTVVGAALTNNHAVSVEIESRIPARDELVDEAFKDNSPNLSEMLTLGDTAPSNPIKGALWSDTGTDNALKRYDGTAWQTV